MAKFFLFLLFSPCISGKSTENTTEMTILSLEEEATTEATGPEARFENDFKNTIFSSKIYFYQLSPLAHFPGFCTRPLPLTLQAACWYKFFTDNLFPTFIRKVECLPIYCTCQHHLKKKLGLLEHRVHLLEEVVKERLPPVTPGKENK